MLIEEGAKEVLVAQDTTAYGIDIYGKPYLSELLKQLVEIKGKFWIRILYAYPSHVDDRL